MCRHCDLTFKNPNVLNIHTLAHAAETAGNYSDIGAMPNEVLEQDRRKFR